MSFYSVIARVSQSSIAAKMRRHALSLRSHRLRRLKPLTPTLSPAVHSAMPSMMHSCTSDLKRRHFRSRHINLSCSGAPVFSIDGRLAAVLDVSAIDPDLSERAHALTGAHTIRSARAIEERFFREQFRREWIVAVAPPEGGARGMAAGCARHLGAASEAAPVRAEGRDHRLSDRQVFAAAPWHGKVAPQISVITGRRPRPRRAPEG